MKLVITGASGFVGRHLLPQLDPQIEVYALARAPESLNEFAQVDIISADLAQPEEKWPLPLSADVILHLAQAPNRFPHNAEEILATNMRSSKNLAEYARSAGVRRFIFASTGNVYQRSAEPHTESDPTEASGYYEFTKLASEELLARYLDSFEVCILRLFTPYGPGQSDRMIPKIAGRVKAGVPVLLNDGGKPMVSPIYIDDLVAVLKQALALEGSLTVNVGGTEQISVEAIAQQAAEYYGTSPRFEKHSGQLDWNLLCNNRLMMKCFDLDDLTPFAEGLPATLDAQEVE